MVFVMSKSVGFNDLPQYSPTENKKSEGTTEVKGILKNKTVSEAGVNALNNKSEEPQPKPDIEEKTSVVNHELDKFESSDGEPVENPVNEKMDHVFNNVVHSENIIVDSAKDKAIQKAKDLGFKLWRQVSIHASPSTGRALSRFFISKNLVEIKEMDPQMISRLSAKHLPKVSVDQLKNLESHHFEKMSLKQFQAIGPENIAKLGHTKALDLMHHFNPSISKEKKIAFMTQVYAAMNPRERAQFYNQLRAENHPDIKQLHKNMLSQRGAFLQPSPKQFDLQGLFDEAYLRVPSEEVPHLQEGEKTVEFYERFVKETNRNLFIFNDGVVPRERNAVLEELYKSTNKDPELTQNLEVLLTQDTTKYMVEQAQQFYGFKGELDVVVESKNTTYETDIDFFTNTVSIKVTTDLEIIDHEDQRKEELATLGFARQETTITIPLDDLKSGNADKAKISVELTPLYENAEAAQKAPLLLSKFEAVENQFTYKPITAKKIALGKVRPEIDKRGKSLEQCREMFKDNLSALAAIDDIEKLQMQHPDKSLSELGLMTLKYYQQQQSYLAKPTTNSVISDWENDMDRAREVVFNKIKQVKEKVLTSEQKEDLKKEIADEIDHLQSESVQKMNEDLTNSQEKIAAFKDRLSALVFETYQTGKFSAVDEEGNPTSENLPKIDPAKLQELKDEFGIKESSDEEDMGLQDVLQMTLENISGKFLGLTKELMGYNTEMKSQGKDTKLLKENLGALATIPYEKVKAAVTEEFDASLKACTDSYFGSPENAKEYALAFTSELLK